MKKITFILTFAAIAFTSQLYSQPKLTIGSQGLFGFPDTITIGDTLNISFWLLNTGNSPLVFDTASGDTVFLNIAVDSAGVIIPGSIHQVIDDSVVFGTLNPLGIDSLLITLPPYPVQSIFYNGNQTNIVVVWPAVTVPGGINTDTLQMPVYVIDTTTGVPIPKDELNTVSIYPNPATDELFLDYNATKNVLERVRIYDVSAKLIYEIYPKVPVQKLDISELKIGVYLIKLDFKDKRTVSGKFIKLDSH